MIDTRPGVFTLASTVLLSERPREPRLPASQAAALAIGASLAMWAAIVVGVRWLIA